MIRLFVGLELPSSAKLALAMLRGDIDGARWLREDQLHLTLRFIGEVTPQTAEDVHEALHAVEFAPLGVALRGLGLFGKMRQPRALWAGVADPAPLRDLHGRIEAALAHAGLPPDERRYIPHVTLARFRGRPRRLEAFLAEHQDFAAPAFTAEHITLFRSHLGRHGARYAIEERYSASGTEPIEDAFDAPGIAGAEERYMHK